MNIKIRKEFHEELCNLDFKEYIFGSQLHGIASEHSDFDYLRVISDNFYKRFTTEAVYLPNIHSFQYTESEKAQYLWMTKSQFYRGLFSGDGNLLADVVLLNKNFNCTDRLNLCRCYRVIKGYIGVAKRDVKLHGNWDKKLFHAQRSLFMAEKLMNNEIPTIEEIKSLYSTPRLTKEQLTQKEKELRVMLNNMLDKGEITLFPSFQEEDELANIMNMSNNIKEFKYENRGVGGL